MSNGKVILGLLAGAAIGATLGILFAPDKGSNTRMKISKKRDDYLDSMKEKINDILESISEKFEVVKEEVADLSEKVKAKPGEVK